MTDPQEKFYCIGCGAQIQTTDPEGLGYTPQSALEKAVTSDADIYCQRCFRLRHYNEISDVSLTDDDFLRLLNQIRDTDALIVNVIDIFDFNGSLIPGLHRFVGDNPVLMVGNKVDLLPKSLRKSKLTNWLLQQAHGAGLRPIDVELVSAHRGTGVAELLEKIEELREGRDVYVVGVTNVGKSTLINRIIKQVSGVQDLITTSQFPGTTLDKIEIPLEDGRSLIDTPGIIHPDQMAHFLGAKDLKVITPKKEIKPTIFQLNEGQTLFLGGLARLDYLRGGRQSIITYLSNELMVHRTKLGNADAFYEKHLGGLLQPPTDTTDLPALTRFEFTTKEKSDIVFSGLGWVNVGPGITVAGYAPKGVSVLLRKAII